ncbi:MAG: hypothetical protein ABIW38_12535 [Ferruginibacter sp.]
MASTAKLILSDSELMFVRDKQFILAKQHIISVVFNMFSCLSENLQPVLKSGKVKLPEEMLYAVPKIYKGEHYINFPYVMMDYPAVFSKKSIIAIRLMFWWSNFFSVTLHVSGTYKNEYEKRINKNIEQSNQELYVCVNDNQWQHHFEDNNYVLVSSKNAKEITSIFEKQSFLKIAIMFPLSDWKNMLTNLENGSLKLMKLLAD